MGQEIKLVNLENGRPRVKQALMQLDFEIQNGRTGNLKVLKIIHGYGSSGVGGTLRIAVREFLSLTKNPPANFVFRQLNDIIMAVSPLLHY